MAIPNTTNRMLMASHGCESSFPVAGNLLRFIPAPFVPTVVAVVDGTAATVDVVDVGVMSPVPPVPATVVDGAADDD